MQKVSVRKLSVLGIVLMAASAVTAAVIPSKSSDNMLAGSVDDATLISNSGATPGAGGIQSCVPDQQGDVDFSCNITTNSRSVNSEAAGFITAGNTSLSTDATGHAGDTTSHA